MNDTVKKHTESSEYRTANKVSANQWYKKEERGELLSSKRDVRNITTRYKEWFLFGFCLYQITKKRHFQDNLGNSNID